MQNPGRPLVREGLAPFFSPPRNWNIPPMLDPDDRALTEEMIESNAQGKRGATIFSLKDACLSF